MEKVSIKEVVGADLAAREAVSAFRTNFMSLGVTSSAVTSFGRHAGTTSVALRLAASIASAGKRVLFIEADMRAGTLARDLSYTDSVAGLSDCLTGKASLADATVGTDEDCLDIVFAGGEVTDPSALLASERYDALIASARAEYDYVIIDTPPVGQVSDCASAVRALDGAVLVINTKHNSCELEKRAAQAIESVGARLLGTVLNRADFSDRGGYYGRAHAARYVR